METELKECPEGMDIKEEMPVELLHPSNRSRFTVVVNRDGLRDRRWSSRTIAWRDIKAIERIRGMQRIIVTLHNPQRYISSMPLFRRLLWRLKNILNIKSFCLNTVALDIRTKELNEVIHRFWQRHRGEISRCGHPGSTSAFPADDGIATVQLTDEALKKRVVRSCQLCAEMLKPEDKICPHCHTPISPAS